MLQKAMVFTLSAAMLVGTPLTASAAELVDLYSIEDGSGNITEGEGPIGTVTNTDTNTNTGILKDNEETIIGIVLDKDYVNAEVGVPETLKASFITTGGELEGTDKARTVLEQLAGKIKWEVLYADGESAKNGVPANRVLNISASASDRTEVTLNPTKGTVKGEEMIVRATVEGRYCLQVVDGETKVKELTTNSTEGYEAEAKVFIKEYSEILAFDPLPDAYVKHTVNLKDYLVRTPVTANDDITWISSDSKVAAVTAAGVVTFMKAGEVTITAVGERGAQVSTKFNVQDGTKASKVVIYVDEDDDGNPIPITSTTLDLNTNLSWEDNTYVRVKMYATVKSVKVNDENKAVLDKNGKPQYVTLKDVEDGTAYYVWNAESETIKTEYVKITDVITWTSSKAAIASVAGDKVDATITANSVGTATITAKASGGKKATLKATVKATLGTLTITNEETGLYTGQSLQMTYTRDPKASKDAVVWSVEKVLKDGTEDTYIKNPNATINSKGVLTIKSKLDDNYSEVTVRLHSKKKVLTGYEEDEEGNFVPVNDYIYTEKTFRLAQSNISSITVTEAGKEAPIATAIIEKDKVKSNKGISKAANTSTLNVSKTGTYNVSVDDNMADTLVWKSSNANIAEITSTGDQVKIYAKKNGTATITVSGVYFTSKNKAATIKTTFKVTVQQPVKTVTLNKTSVVINRKDNKKGEPQKQTVSFKATLGPKGYKKETVKWEVKTTKGNSTAEFKKQDGKLTLNAPVVGDEFVVTASVPTGAKATATIKVLAKTTGVAIAKENQLADGAPVLYADAEKNGKKVNNTANLMLGKSIPMYPFINISTEKKGNDWKAAGTDVYEGVTYSVNKKGIVTITSDGRVYGIKPGTVKITAKTPLGKKTTLTVTVNLPEPEAGK